MISYKTKWTAFTRFLTITVIFVLLMVEIGTLPALPLAALSLQFFWLCHFNGRLFDGRKPSWLMEGVTQLLYGAVLYWAVFSQQNDIITGITVLLAVTSLISYLVFRSDTTQFEPIESNLQQQ